MRPSFSEVWQDIRDQLSSGTEVRYWRRTAAPTENVFRIERINYDEVAISGKGISGIRSVSRRDFATLYDHWDDYKNNGIHRHEIGNNSRNSSYVFSIFRWLEAAKK